MTNNNQNTNQQVHSIIQEIKKYKPDRNLPRWKANDELVEFLMEKSGKLADYCNDEDDINSLGGFKFKGVIGMAKTHYLTVYIRNAFGISYNPGIGYLAEGNYYLNLAMACIAGNKTLKITHNPTTKTPRALLECLRLIIRFKWMGDKKYQGYIYYKLLEHNITERQVRDLIRYLKDIGDTSTATSLYHDIQGFNADDVESYQAVKYYSLRPHKYCQYVESLSELIDQDQLFVLEMVRKAQEMFP